MVRPTSTLSLRRPISGHSNVPVERFFTQYNKEVLNMGDDIPFEDLFDRNERTICATFARFGDLSYHTPNYRIGAYMQNSAKLKQRHLLEVIALQNTVTSVEKNEFEIPIQLAVIDPKNPGQKRLKTGVSSVFKKEEVEREPITVSLFPEYFEDPDAADSGVDEQEPNREALKFLEKHLAKMGGHYDPETIGQDDYQYLALPTLPRDFQDMIRLSYRRLEKFLADPNFIKNEEIARFKKSWISHAISRVPEKLLSKDDEEVRTIFQEIFHDYRQAIKRSILNYLLLSAEERRRLSIPMILRESPPSSDRIVRAGGYSILLYHDWHAYVENGKNYLQNNLYNMNIVNSSLVTWYEDFKNIELVETDIIKHMAVLGRSMSAFTFIKIQRNYRERVQSFMRHVWYKGSILILKRFKYIRLHKEKKGQWNLLGFSREHLDLKGFLKTSIESISTKKGNDQEDSAEAAFNVINTRLNESVANLLDVPLAKWGAIGFNDLLDIRDCPSYEYYALYNKEPVLMAENGYKLLSPEVRTRLRASVGTLLALQLRQKVDSSLKIFEDMIMTLPLFSQFISTEEGSRSAREESFVNAPSVSDRNTGTIQELASVAQESKRSEGLVPSSNNLGAASRAGLPPMSKDLMFKQHDGLDPNFIKAKSGRVVGPVLEFAEIKAAVEPPDVFFMTFKFAEPSFLKYQGNFQPFLQLEMLMENEIIKFGDTEDVLRTYFSKMHTEIVELFKYFSHPEFISVHVKDDPIEVHPKESYPLDNNHEAFYKRFMPYLELKEKKRKRKVQSILESAQVEDVDEKTKHLSVNETSEAQYLESCKMIADRVLQHYHEAKVSFQLLNQFKLVQDKTLENSVKSFLKRNHISLEDFRKNLLMVRAYQELLKDVPDDVYFPLFRVRTVEVKQHFSQVLTELERALEERVKNFLAEEMQKIKNDFQRLKDTMNKPIDNATQYQVMDNFMTSLTQDKIQLRNRSHDIYKKIIFCSKLFVTDGELLMKAKEIFDCPSQLESNITIASIKHSEFKRKLLQDLEFRVERYSATLKEVNAGLADLQAVNNFDHFHSNMMNVQKLDAKTGSLESERKEILDQEVKLKGKITSEYKDVLDMRKRLTPLQELWEAVSAFMEVRNDVYNRRVFEVGMLEIDDAVSNAKRAVTMLKVSFAKSKEEMKIVDNLEKKIGNLLEDYNIIEIVCNKGLCERHWDQIKESVNNMAFNYKEDRLSDLLENPDILKNMTAIQKISKQASVEYKLLQMLQKIESDWKDRRFELMSWKNSDILIFAGATYEEIQMLLDDNVLRIQTILSDPGVKFMEALAKEWEERLEFMQETCEVWVKVQQAYIYLVPVFQSEDIRTHLAKSAVEFKKVQAIWEDLMHAVNENPLATSIQQIPQLLPKLRDILTIMEHNLKELDEYLDMKRTKFSRFFFLSNEEMLSILSETKDPQLVQPHLKKCFEGINRLAFTIENDITGMLSEMGETIDFESKIIPKNHKSAVEEWLVKIEEQMKISLRSKVEEALIDLGQYKGSRSTWLRKWPGQAILACSQVSWTMLVEDRLKLIKQMKDLKDELTLQLEEIVKMIRGELSAIERTTLNALITLEVHNLDIVSELIAQRCNNTQDFDWLSQLRYYIHADKPMTVEMVMTKIDYGFEYLGNTPRLVITPLTDRCYRTLMSALFLNLGGAPEGPAGTGKTETTKDLAKAVAIQCVVHNCTGAMNSGAMAKFFKGLVSSGAWSCFDEFNRIQVEVLSVIAQQIHQIQTAKAAKVKEFKFDGTMLKIKDSCNIFITMNPGYAGRSELPDNLKSLFRPVAMMVPDYATIAEISLYSTGFIDARKLSKKIVAVYKLCSEQLSSQYHYDYGMRTVKSVLVTAAMLKRRMRGATEDDIILQSIKDVNLPKFVDQDLDIFKFILMDLFPLSTLVEKDNPRVDETLTRLMKNNKLTATTAMKTKIFQLNEMIKTRHGLMLVGDAMSGKSTVYKTLAQTLNALNAEGDDELAVNYVVINPKAISINQIYGYSDPISQEWTEGILSHAFKQASKRHKTREWLVLDGPVDADWIENMNTVLDDNKCLCLMSSDKIPMSKYMTMVFETENLAKASPATVSRCGMIYLNYDLVGLRNYYHKWILQTFETMFDSDMIDHLLDLFDIIFRQSVKLIESSRKQYQYISEMSLLSSFLHYFKLLLAETHFLDQKPSEDEMPKAKPRLNMLFVHAVAWSLGMSTLSTFRKEFDKFLRRLVAESVKSEIKPDRIVKFDRDVVPPEHQGTMM